MTLPILGDEKTKSLLKGIPYFRGLNDQALETVAQAVIVRHYHAGELIFLEGEPVAGLHLVVEGYVKSIGSLREGGSISWRLQGRAIPAMKCRSSTAAPIRLTWGRSRTQLFGSSLKRP